MLEYVVEANVPEVIDLVEKSIRIIFSRHVLFVKPVGLSSRNMLIKDLINSGLTRFTCV